MSRPWGGLTLARGWDSSAFLTTAKCILDEASGEGTRIDDGGESSKERRVQEERSASEGGPYIVLAAELSPCEKWGSAAEELFEEEAGEAAGMVAEDAVFLEEIVEDDAEAEFLEGGKIDGHRLRALCAVTPGHIGRDGLTIGDDPIDDAARNVFLDGAEMIAEGVAGGFAGLGHQIGDVDARSFGIGDGAGDFRN